MLASAFLGAEDIQVVLVVDDDRDVREVVTDALEAEGYRVIACTHGQEALDWLRAAGNPEPILILFDLTMQEMDGIQFRAELLRDPALSGIPVVVLAADPSATATNRSLLFAGYLKKPIQLDALLAVVAAHQAGHKPSSTP